MTATWSAPGRANLIGEHVDYNDGLVLPFALPFSTTARVQSTRSGQVDVASVDSDLRASFPVDTSPGDVKGWAAYVAGVVWALTVNRAESDDTVLPPVPPLAAGLDIEITSNVPIGAGLSSSAALECAVAGALNDELELGLAAETIADVARRAENDYVGVPTGRMDQLASMLCQSAHAMLLDCRSLEVSQLPFDPSASGLALVVINTMAEHSLEGSEYADRRRDCERAAVELGVDALRDATVEQVERLENSQLRRRAHHVVTEIQRVREVAELLRGGRADEIGGLLTASHQSLRDDFEVSIDELDVAVDVAVDAGALGARLTGGGFGGCVIALCREGDVDRVRTAVMAAYEAHDWESPTVWTATPAEGAHRVD